MGHPVVLGYIPGAQGRIIVCREHRHHSLTRPSLMLLRALLYHSYYGHMKAQEAGHRVMDKDDVVRRRREQFERQKEYERLDSMFKVGSPCHAPFVSSNRRSLRCPCSWSGMSAPLSPRTSTHSSLACTCVIPIILLARPKSPPPPRGAGVSAQPGRRSPPGSAAPP